MNRRQFLASIAAVVPALPFVKAEIAEPESYDVIVSSWTVPDGSTGALPPAQYITVPRLDAELFAMVEQAGSEYGAVWFSGKLDG